jgi:hypothetical protein
MSSISTKAMSDSSIKLDVANRYWYVVNYYYVAFLYTLFLVDNNA